MGTMATQSPFSLFDGAWARVRQRLATGPQPPQWLVHEVQHRIVLLLNHVLMQEPQAMQRLERQSGRTLRMQWRAFFMALRITPAGLLDLADLTLDQPADLRLEVTETSPVALARGMLQGAAQGETPSGLRASIRIEGDVQLAGDMQWLVDHVRWDVEEDLARIVGDAPAHAAASVARQAAAALRRFVLRRDPATP